MTNKDWKFLFEEARLHERDRTIFFWVGAVAGFIVGFLIGVS